MIIQPTIPGGYVIFCDDIRQEVNSKQTLVGTYGGEMTVFGTAPAMLSKLCIVARLRIDPETLPKKIIFRVSKDVGDNSETLLEAPLEVPALSEEFPFPEPITSDSLNFLEVGFDPHFGNLVFTEPCVLRVRAFIDDDEYRIGALSVKIAPRPQSAVSA